MKRFYFLFVLSLFFISCNTFSSQNHSNNWRWRNKKFSDNVYIKLDFNPYIIKEGLIDPMFYVNGADTLNLMSHYKIETILEEKLKQRNIIKDKKAKSSIQIDTLIFKEYFRDITVYFLDGESEDSEEDYFIFTIIGHIIDSTGHSKKISANISHHTSPRESYVFNCMIAKDGINAKDVKMIENTLNDFSYQVFKTLEEKDSN